MKRSKIKNKGEFRPTFFAFPYMALSVIFVIVPLFLLLYYAFTSEGSFSLKNFGTVLSVTNLVLLLKTIGIALLTTVICLLISYPTALILASKPFNKYAILALLFIIPMWMNFVLRILALKSLLFYIGIYYGLGLTIIGMVYDFLPFMLLPIYTVLTNMDKSYIEASADLGASPIRTFFKVTLPLSLKGVFSGITMVFMPVFSAYAITGMLGDTGTSVLGGKIEELFRNNAWGTGSALAFVMLLIVLITSIVGNLISRRTPDEKVTVKAVTK